MNTKNLSLNYGSQRQVVESFIKIIPDIMIAIFFCYLIIEAIHICDISRLMVSSQQHYHFRIFHLVQKQQQNCLHRIEASVNVISKKDITFFRNRSSFTEELQQIPKLTMNIAADCYWSLYRLHI